MKLWQKICISSLLFFLAVFTGANIIMIENSRKITFNRILRQSADEQENISSGIVRYVWTNLKGEDTRYQDTIIEYLDGRINPQGTWLEIQAEGEVLYSNLDFDLSISINNGYAGRIAEYKVLEIDGRQYLALSNHVEVKSLMIKNLYLVDISDIYSDVKAQYAFFIKLMVGISIIIVAGMFFITRHFTKSLRILRDSVKKIKAGNYAERVEIKIKDEAGELAESYNDMAAAIEGTIEELQNKTQEQQRFIDNFTHELRTPLTAVVGYADLLRSTSGNEEYAQELGERIFREGKRIENLSEVMMDLVFLKRHTFELEPCDIGVAVRQAAENFGPAATKAGISLELVLPDEPLLILAKRELILVLLGNLTDNAGKASKEGGRIWIRARSEEENVIVEVEDEGKGIPIGEQSKIFESFYMVDKARNRKRNGLGLGLSICEDILKIHHANIELSSQEEKGTLIKIIFSCYKEDTNVF